MIEELVKTIPQSLLSCSGKALCSGRRAFAGPADLYIIDYHPGGDPEQFPETVAEQIDQVLNHEPADWSAYLNESWQGQPPGSRPQQRRVAQLCDSLGLNPGAVPAAQLIFRRWDDGSAPAAALERQWAEEGWPFHQAVIDRLGVRVVVCLGQYPGKWVCRKLDAAPEAIAEFKEANHRGWASNVHQSGGRYIISLTHPVRANWLNPAADPTPLVRRALAAVRGG